jgi:ligand-binding sensor domain-containing protein
MVVEKRLLGDRVWFGTTQGLSRLDLNSGDWSNFTSQNSGIGTGGVSDLLIDTRGRLWVATLGGGFSIMDGSEWRHYRVSNSGLPQNMIREIAEIEPGLFWIASSNPDSAGGMISRFDGGEWYTVNPRRSGYSGAETVAIAKDAGGILWFGTLTSGVDRYQARD